MDELVEVVHGPNLIMCTCSLCYGFSLLLIKQPHRLKMLNYGLYFRF